MEVWLGVLAQMVDIVTQVVMMLVIIQMIIGLLFAFNVISGRNEFLGTVFTSINRLMEPVLGPIRRRMPDTGAIDFSPIILLILLSFLRLILDGVQQSI